MIKYWFDADFKEREHRVGKRSIHDVIELKKTGLVGLEPTTCYTQNSRSDH